MSRLPLLPVAPVVPLVIAAGGPVRLPEAVRRAYHRGLKRGTLTFEAADEIAMTLGHHPSELWGESFYAILGPPDAKGR